MNLIIDSNILISALIKDSVKRKIIMQSGWRFYYPLEAIKEIEKYKLLIMDKTGFSEEDFNLIFHYLTSYLELIPQELISAKMVDAEKIIGKIDRDDVLFIATALSVDNEGIWTDDEHFQMQNKIKAFNTKDLLKKFNTNID